MKLFAGLVTIFVLVCMTVASNVIELTDKNFQSVVVDSKIPTIVDIYASWCGHCKRLNPVYDELATAFSHLKSKVQIVKIDGDIHRKTAKKYGVTGFPTIKFFNADGSIDDVNVPRDLDSLSNFITEKTGLRKKFSIPQPSIVTSLSDSNFETTVGEKNKTAIVAFTASWCGHCKTLKPIYKEVAEIFRYDDNVVIAEVDTTAGEAKGLMAKFGVSSFPTILVFPYGEIPEASEVEQYKGPRTLDALVERVNILAGTGRKTDGSLNDYAGRFKKLDSFAKEFVEATSEIRGFIKEKIVRFMFNAHAEKKIAAESAAKQYLKIAEKVEASEEYLEKEIKRLSGIISRGGLKRSKLDELSKKLNILKIFVPGAEPDEEEQTEEEPVVADKKEKSGNAKDEQAILKAPKEGSKEKDEL